MNIISRELELPGAFILGAAAAPSRIAGMNAEVYVWHFQVRAQQDVKAAYVQRLQLCKTIPLGIVGASDTESCIN